MWPGLVSPKPNATNFCSMKKLLVRAGVVSAAISGAVVSFLGTAHAALIALPSSTDLYAGVETYSSVTFTEFLVLVLAGVGITIAAIVLGFFAGKIVGAAKSLMGRKKRGRGRRR